MVRITLTIEIRNAPATMFHRHGARFSQQEHPGVLRHVEGVADPAAGASLPGLRNASNTDFT
jgi:hypothetical protein